MEVFYGKDTGSYDEAAITRDTSAGAMKDTWSLRHLMAMKRFITGIK